MNGLVMVVHVDEGHDDRGEVVDVVVVVEHGAHRPRDTRAMRAIHCLHTCTMSMQSCGARVAHGASAWACERGTLLHAYALTVCRSRLDVHAVCFRASEAQRTRALGAACRIARAWPRRITA